MKRVNILMTILFFSLFLTGCGKQTLKCSKTEELEAGKAIEKQTIVFENNNISKYSASMQFKVNDEYKDFKNTLFESLENSFKEYDNQDGIKYNVKKDNDNILITIEGDYSKMNSKAQENLKLLKSSSLDKALESLENDGYNCKH